MPTRWGSTLLMVSRYLKIDNVLRLAHEHIVRFNIKFQGSGPAAPITLSEKNLMLSIISLIQYFYNATEILSRTNELTGNCVDMLTSGIISNLDRFRKKEKKLN